MKVCRNSEGLMSHYPVRESSNFKTHAAELRVPCVYIKCRVSRPLFKNRKHTVDAGKMWPDCIGRLSYFNLRPDSTFSVTYFDLWWIANQVFLQHVPNLPNTCKPHLLWRPGVTNKQSLGTGLPLTTNVKGLLQSTTSNAEIKSSVFNQALTQDDLLEETNLTLETNRCSLTPDDSEFKTHFPLPGCLYYGEIQGRPQGKWSEDWPYGTNFIFVTFALTGKNKVLICGQEQGWQENYQE